MMERLEQPATATQLVQAQTTATVALALHQSAQSFAEMARSERIQPSMKHVTTVRSLQHPVVLQTAQAQNRDFTVTQLNQLYAQLNVEIISKPIMKLVMMETNFV